RLQQHGAALAAADTLAGDAAPQPQSVETVGQVQDDAVAAGAHRVAEADGAAVDIEPVRGDSPQGAVETEHGAAEVAASPGLEAGQHLGGKRFVDFPQVDIIEPEVATLEQLGGA